MPTHVALLRAINVGGPSRKIAMADLRAVVEAAGHRDVATYIQSGNVVLTSDEPGPSVIAADLERRIADVLGVSPCPVVVLDRAEYDRAIADNPFPDEPDPKKVHAVFRAVPPDADERDAVARAEEQAREKGSRDTAVIVGRVVYLHLPDGMGRSELAARLGKLPSARKATDGGGTARNWKTVRTLQEMLAAEPG